MIPEQQPLVPLYTLIFDRGDILNLQPFADYALTRYRDRVGFDGTAMCMHIGHKERERLLRFLRYHNLGQYLVFDDGRKGDPWRVNISTGATGATCSSESSSTTTELILTPDTTTAESILNVPSAELRRT